MPDNPPKENTDVTGQPGRDPGPPLTAETRLVSGPAASGQTALPAIPDHQLLRCIGRGSYGEVWLARNVMGTYRAVKIVYRRNFDNDRPYEREFDGIHKFEPISRSHDGLVDILHVGRNDEAGYFYYVMEVADDVTGQPIAPDTYQPKTLRREIHERGRLLVAECVPISLKLTSGLSYLHEQGLVHRDIKPANIIFVKGAPKLADIGLVCGAEGTISYVGTEGFIPPEGPGSSQADIYSLGKVFYEMSTGKDRQDFPDLPTALRSGDTEREGLLEFNEVLLKACASETRQRYQTAQEMETDLALLQSGKSIKRQRALSRRWAAAKIVGMIGAGATLLLIALPWLKKELARQQFADQTEKSIAVLRFDETSSQADELNLGEAIPGEVINLLTPISGLKVAARSSSFQATNDDPRVIGKRLRVRALLKGWVHRKADEKLDVTIELISAANGYLLTSKTYPGAVKDLPAIHNEIARQIATTLKLPLGTEESQQLAKIPTENTAAYRAYLLGRQHWNQRMNPGEVQLASKYFAQAIELDTDFALAYAGLAETYAQRGYLAPGDLRPRDAFPKAKELATKALAIDDRLAEAHVALGFGYTHHDWDWERAEREFKEATNGNPRYAEAHHEYSHLLMALGRTNESFHESQIALELEPFDAVMNAHLGWHYFYSRQYDLGMRQWEKTIPMDPNFPMPLYFRGCAHRQQGEFESAIADFEKAAQVSKNKPLMLAALGHAYAASKRTEDALKILAQLNERAKKEYVDPAEVAFIYIGLGDKDQAFVCLTNALAERSGWLAYLNVDPIFDSLRDDPRFSALLKAVGLLLPPRDKSIAVLRFENNTLSPDQEYLSEEIPEQIIGVLAQIAGLTVRSRNSSFAFKGRTDRKNIAGELQVQNLLVGSISKVGNQLRLTAELIDSEGDSELMLAGPYDLTKELVTIPGDVAQRVAEALKIPLSPETTQRVTKRPTDNPEAFRACAQGRFSWNKRTAADLRQAIEHFERARAIDPNYALAYAGLSEAYSSLALSAFVADACAPANFMPLAEAAAQKALSMDPTLAAAHVALFFVRFYYDWNWEEAEHEMKEALRLDPASAHAHHWFSHYWMAIGRTSESLAESQAALLDFIISGHLGWHYLCAGEPERAIQELQKPLLINDKFYLSRRYVGLAYEQKGDYTNAINAFRKACASQTNSAEAAAELAHAYAKGGQANEARAILNELEQRRKTGFVSAYNFALIHAGLGETVQALDSLEEAYKQKSDRLVDLKIERAFSDLRSEKRFVTLLRNLKFEK